MKYYKSIKSDKDWYDVEKEEDNETIEIRTYDFKYGSLVEGQWTRPGEIIGSVQNNGNGLSVVLEDGTSMDLDYAQAHDLVMMLKFAYNDGAGSLPEFSSIALTDMEKF